MRKRGRGPGGGPRWWGPAGRGMKDGFVTMGIVTLPSEVGLRPAIQNDFYVASSKLFELTSRKKYKKSILSSVEFWFRNVGL